MVGVRWRDDRYVVVESLSIYGCRGGVVVVMVSCAVAKNDREEENVADYS